MMKKKIDKNEVSILSFGESYLDGGTEEIIFLGKNYFIDHRIDTDTEGRIYDAYPDEGKIIHPDLERIILDEIKRLRK